MKIVNGTQVCAKKIRDAIESLDRSWSSTSTQMLNAAFASVKNVSTGEYPLVEKLGLPFDHAFKSLSEKLHSFLISYNSSLTDEQRLRGNKINNIVNNTQKTMTKITHMDFLRRQDPGGFCGAIYAKEEIDRLALEMKVSIEALKVGDVFLIPGGCVGHAVLFEVKRVEGDKFQFSIFNTGEGIALGHTKISSTQVSSAVFVGLSKEAVSDSAFIATLLESSLSAPSMKPVYIAIQEQFIHKYSGRKIEGKPHDIQTWGTCTFDSIRAFLENALPSSLFVSFEYDMMLRAKIKLNELFSSVVHLSKSTTTANFIDSKSCDTVVTWKNKFLEYCIPKDEGEIADIVLGKGQIQEQTTMKSLFEKWSAVAFNVDQAARGTETTNLAMALGGGGFASILGGGTLAHTIYNYRRHNLMSKATFVGRVVAIGLGLLNGGISTYGFVGMFPFLESSDSLIDRNKKATFMKRIEAIVKKTQPESMRTLKMRGEALFPSVSPWDPLFESSPKKMPVLKDLNLNSTLKYLQKIYSEMVFCRIPDLQPFSTLFLNATSTCPRL